MLGVLLMMFDAVADLCKASSCSKSCCSTCFCCEMLYRLTSTAGDALTGSCTDTQRKVYSTATETFSGGLE